MINTGMDNTHPENVYNLEGKKMEHLQLAKTHCTKSTCRKGKPIALQYWGYQNLVG